MKKLIEILIVLAALVVAFILGRNLILKIAIEKGVTALTGFQTSVDSINVDWPAAVHVRGLKIHNPPQYQNRIFADAPEIFLAVDLLRFLKTKDLYLPEVRLNFQEINLEKDPQGVSNISLLTSIAQPKGGEKKPSAPSQGKKGAFYLEKLELTMRKVGYQDRSLPIPKKLSTDLHVDKQVFKGIKEPAALVSLILLKITYGTTFGNLGINPAALEGSLKDAAATGEALVNQTKTMVMDNANELLQGDVGGVLSDTTSTAKQGVTGLFGKVKTLASKAESTVNS